MVVKTYDELRASHPGTVCEHGARERSCPHCESNAAHQEVERLQARVVELEAKLCEVSVQKGEDRAYDGPYPWVQCRLCGVKQHLPGTLIHEDGCLVAERASQDDERKEAGQ